MKILMFALSLFSLLVSAMAIEAVLPQPPAAVWDVDSLACLSWQELEAIYRCAGPGPIPVGYLRGRAIYDRCDHFSDIRTKVTDKFWLGKHFCCDGKLVNQWSHACMVKARVCPGQSWLDGGPSIIMDYRGESLIWSKVRDEMREVSPGVYVGIMFRESGQCPKIKTYFALQRCE